ncbi:hypothetical protein F4801DRAFT_559580 [Xylaria longipes]|nr:hypothetical protein F4801DRAFT_559580 [Xylaria longipes]
MADWHADFNPLIPRTFDLERLHNIFLSTVWTFCAQFSPDDEFIAVGCNRGVQILRTDTGQLVHDLKHDSLRDDLCDSVKAIRFFANGKTLAAGGDDGKITLWDISSSRVLHTFVDTGAPVSCIDISKDSSLLIAGSEDHIVRVWDCQSKERGAEIRLRSCVNSLSVSQDQKIVAVGTADGVTLLDFPGCALIRDIGGDDAHDDLVRSLAFSPADRRLATSSLDKTVKIWDISPTGQANCLRTFEGHENIVTSVCWSSNGRWIISGSKDQSVRVWDAESGSAYAVIRGHSNSVLSITSATEKCLFVTTGADLGRFCIWSYSLRDTTQITSTREPADNQPWRSEGSLLRPGYGLPIHFLPPAKKRFPVLMGNEDNDWTASTLHVREVCMLKMLDELTDKPEWWRKAQDPEIAAKWKREAMAMDWASYRRHGDFTSAMADACIIELQRKADLYEKTGLIPVYDYSACAIKSDTVAEALYDKLRLAVLSLESVPEDQKDWHPGSQGKVLDLVHPSLWPLVYGRTRIITTGSIDVHNCLNSCGQGKVISKLTPADLIIKENWPRCGGVDDSFPSLSLNFQWLPCDVAIDRDGHAMIGSYINSLHPSNHLGLYKLIGEFIQQSLPAWDTIYRWPKEFPFQRLQTESVGPHCTTPGICGSGDGHLWCECVPTNRPLNEGEPGRGDDEADDEHYEESPRGQLDKEWFDNTHPLLPPDAKTEGAPNMRADGYFRLGPEDIKSSGYFKGTSRIQVIVKLANIHLTPENPSYDGGSWHIEGQLNEHICATALFYYDIVNITDSRLAFRTKSNREELASSLGYKQNDYKSISRTFAIYAEPGQDSTIQDVGSVLTRQGRALFFPNLYQHRVQPFSLADPSKPGHRKILALFLVDPAIPVISTANVPPQQPHWKTNSNLGTTPESDEATIRRGEDVMDLAEAKRIRDELIKERSALQTATTQKCEEATFNFCEH